MRGLEEKSGGLGVGEKQEPTERVDNGVNVKQEPTETMWSTRG